MSDARPRVMGCALRDLGMMMRVLLAMAVGVAIGYGVGRLR